MRRPSRAGAAKDFTVVIRPLVYDQLQHQPELAVANPQSPDPSDDSGQFCANIGLEST